VSKPSADKRHAFNDFLRRLTFDFFGSGQHKTTIVYAYLQLKGFGGMRILARGWAGIMEQAKPGRLWKPLKAQGRRS